MMAIQLDFIQKYHEKCRKELDPVLPIYYIRYEDLRVDPQKTLEGLFAFLLDVESVEGMNI